MSSPSKATTLHTGGPPQQTALGREPHLNTTVHLPSEHVTPTEVDTVPQQGSTQSGDGGEVHASDNRPTRRQTAEQVPFKERVIGVAQKTRGTLLGKPELKEHGEKILGGETTHEQDRRA